MASPIRKVPMSKLGVVPSERIMMPVVNKMRDMNNVNSIPKRRAIFGANGEMSANASKGMVVKNPASTFEMAKLSLMEEISGPTDVNGDRSVDAMKMIPIRRNQVFRVNINFLLVCMKCGLFKIIPPNSTCFIKNNRFIMHSMFIELSESFFNCSGC
jgi:hypothetical protein